MTGLPDAESWSKALGISREAVELYLSSEVVDLHLDTFIWQRIFGYDPRRRHGRPPLGGWFLGHVDLPRLREAHLAAATWVITTNPLREAADRFDVLVRNLDELTATLGDPTARSAVCRTFSDYRRARESGLHAAFIGIQGGNALEHPEDALERLPALTLLRVTLMHLSSSRVGTTSSPLRAGSDAGLTAFGREMVQRLNAAKVLVDLAHISEAGFWDAIDVHARDVPPVVTHTGVSGVHRHWRNLDDSQLRAIADGGGVVGIMFHAPFLGGTPWSGRSDLIAQHLAHVVRVAGEDVAAIGSDFDGAITPPRDLTSVLELPRLVEHLLRRGFSERVIRKILGGNFLSLLGRIRP